MITLVSLPFLKNGLRPKNVCCRYIKLLGGREGWLEELPLLQVYVREGYGIWNITKSAYTFQNICILRQQSTGTNVRLQLHIARFTGWYVQILKISTGTTGSFILSSIMMNKDYVLPGTRYSEYQNNVALGLWYGTDLHTGNYLCASSDVEITYSNVDSI